MKTLPLLASSLAFAALILVAQTADATSVRKNYAACEQAISADLGEGFVRQNVVQISNQGATGHHWINVRHRAEGDTSTQRYRVKCTTEGQGAVAELDITEGAWKKARRNRPPKAID